MNKIEPIPMTDEEKTKEEIKEIFENEDIKDFIFDKFTDFLAYVDEYEYEDILWMKKELDNWIKKIEILRLIPKKCPKCESDKVLKIEYGLPLFDDDHSARSDIYLAGCVCMVPASEWICKKCHWEWGKNVAGRYSEETFDD